MAAHQDNIVLSNQTLISQAMPGDYFQLLKPRVMYLVIFTAFVGMLIAPVPLNPTLSFVAILCISIGAGASGALNMWYDADIDVIMGRTSRRPVPSGQITPNQALGFGLILSFFSVMLLGLAINWLSAFLLAFTIFFYAVIYTMWLKRWTSQNIVIGGAAGAIPPVIGWAAVTNSIAFEPIVLFAIIFLWTPPHFWALALFRQADYEKACIPMLPNVAGAVPTRKQILFYSVALAVSGILPSYFGFASIHYGVFAVLFGGWFVYLAWRVWQSNNEDGSFKREKHLFGFSIIYLFAIFSALGIDAIIGRML